MASIQPVLGLLGVVFFVLPGLMGIRAFFYTSKKADPLSRTDTIAWSFLLSLFSMSFIYFLYIIYLCRLPVIQTLIPYVNSLPKAMAHYVGIIIISILTGFIIGRLVEWNSDDVRSRRDLWEFYMNNLIENEEEYILRVVTSRGERVGGQLKKYGSSAQNKDLVLESPTTNVLNNTGGQEEDEIKTEVENWTGQVYFQEDDIEQVHFDSLWDADKIELQEEETDEEQQEEQDEAIGRLEKRASAAEENGDNSDKS